MLKLLLNGTALPTLWGRGLNKLHFAQPATLILAWGPCHDLSRVATGHWEGRPACVNNQLLCLELC